jgi:histidine ammonia-lyase
MGGFAARKAKILYDNMAFILGIELMCALQAVDLLQMRPSSKLQ